MKVSKEHIDNLLSKCTLHYNRLHGTTTICQVVLPNGFMVATGMSGCIDPANFDEKLGRKYAKQNALKAAEDKLWEMEGYRMIMEARPVN